MVLHFTGTCCPLRATPGVGLRPVSRSQARRKLPEQRGIQSSPFISAESSAAQYTYFVQQIFFCCWGHSNTIQNCYYRCLAFILFLKILKEIKAQAASVDVVVLLEQLLSRTLQLFPCPSAALFMSSLIIAQVRSPIPSWHPLFVQQHRLQRLLAG